MLKLSFESISPHLKHPQVTLIEENEIWRNSYKNDDNFLTLISHFYQTLSVRRHAYLKSETFFVMFEFLSFGQFFTLLEAIDKEYPETILDYIQLAQSSPTQSHCLFLSRLYLLHEMNKLALIFKQSYLKILENLDLNKNENNQLIEEKNTIDSQEENDDEDEELISQQIAKEKEEDAIQQLNHQENLVKEKINNLPKPKESEELMDISHDLDEQFDSENIQDSLIEKEETMAELLEETEDSDEVIHVFIDEKQQKQFIALEEKFTEHDDAIDITTAWAEDMKVISHYPSDGMPSSKEPEDIMNILHEVYEIFEEKVKEEIKENEEIEKEDIPIFNDHVQKRYSENQDDDDYEDEDEDEDEDEEITISNKKKFSHEDVSTSLLWQDIHQLRNFFNEQNFATYNLKKDIVTSKANHKSFYHRTYELKKDYYLPELSVEEFKNNTALNVFHQYQLSKKLSELYDVLK